MNFEVVGQPQGKVLAALPTRLQAQAKADELSEQLNHYRNILLPQRARSPYAELITGKDCPQGSPSVWFERFEVREVTLGV